MNRVLEHVVHEIWVGLYEVVQHLEDFQVFLLSLEESTEGHIVSVEVYSGDRGGELLPILNDGLISLLDLLLFLLQAFKLLVDLLFHHCVKVLLLNLELLDNPAEGLLESLNLLIKLLPDLLLKFSIEVFTHTIVPVNCVDLLKHVPNHFLHFQYYNKQN